MQDLKLLGDGYLLWNSLTLMLPFHHKKAPLTPQCVGMKDNKIHFKRETVFRRLSILAQS